MAKIRIEFECNGDAKEFFNGVMQDYYYSVKNSEDEELRDQYESAVYEITDKPHIYADHLGKVLESRATFASYAAERDLTSDTAAIDLIGAIYDLDGDELSDDELLENIALILQYAKELSDPALNCECGYQH
jgi:hypothetical protein